MLNNDILNKPVAIYKMFYASESQNIYGQEKI